MNNVQFKCPKCGYPQHCGCNSCRNRPTHTGKKRQVLVDQEHYKCVNCGLAEHMEWWANEEYKQKFPEDCKDEISK